ncbi:hypothetical protein JQK87_33070 [Streptomyces sp. G44]|uniref:HAAS signaling domain-containing protein n=1 Tax=Streptomyces sp. G44 TaxID=2807632 RepID=UPI0019617F7D|nr:hypothetical protein [Streptomyces sp. G44]MBM7173138.1 hypothetical protein [Streptomyces sp. G44]
MNTQEDEQDTYLTDLAGRLRAHGLPADRVEATVADLTAHLEESGAKDAEAEFGPAEEFARQLVPEAATPDGPPDGHVETWRWTADTYGDEELLNRFGDEGWEVERVDAVGRFVSHRDLARPQRWEYRRELITRGREDRNERLAPDGWEACGTWVIYAWFKRPKAASLGPAAELAAPPPAPERTNFLSRKFYALLAVLGAAVVLGGLGAGLDDGDASSGLGFAAGLLAGACVPFGLIVGGRLWIDRRRR